MGILVTGYSGFIGKRLYEHIEKEIGIVSHKIEVSDFYHSTVKWKEKLEKYLDEISPDIIFHVGACSDTLEKNVNYMMELNYESTKILVDWCKKNDRKMIYSSSAANYGTGLGYPSNLYGWSKYVAEGYVVSNNGIALRYFNVYGPGESHKGKMSSVALQMHKKRNNGEPIFIFPGEPKRDFVYIDDVISSNIFSMNNYEKLKSDWYDVGSFSARSFEDVLINIGIDKWEYYKKEEIPEGYQFFTKATKGIPGWYPKYTLEEGLKDYMDFLKNE